MTLPRTGYYEISGIAWSGAGRIRRVEVSTDGGATWAEAALTGEERPKSLVRFRLPWEWTGKEAVLQSRATDEKGACSRRARSGSRNSRRMCAITTIPSSAGRGRRREREKCLRLNAPSSSRSALRRSLPAQACRLGRQAAGVRCGGERGRNRALGHQHSPSGAGLPRAAASARQGLQVYEQKCMACHGAKGAASRPIRSRRSRLALARRRCARRKLLAVCDHAVRLRAAGDADRQSLSLTDDEVYAVSA